MHHSNRRLTLARRVIYVDLYIVVEKSNLEFVA